MSPSTAGTHECPAPACELQLPFARFACRSHWYAIPPELRGQLLREYNEHFGETSYFQARADCLRALGIPEDEIASLNGGVA